MAEEIVPGYSAKEKAELLISSLRKLKAEVSAIEGRCDVLKNDYSRLCDDAISRISAGKAELETEINSEIKRLDDFKTEINNLEARFKLGLVPPNIYLKQKKVNGKSASYGGVQSAVDKIAGSIESGLDKMGDAVTFLADGISGIGSVLSGSKPGKARKSRPV